MLIGLSVWFYPSYRRSPIMNMVTRAHQQAEDMAVSYSCSSGKNKSLLMNKDLRQNLVTWVAEFDGTKTKYA
jgi:hypothetical protein